MTPKDQTHLSKLQATFNATGLGEGDPVAGLNTLAAMACSIANVARPGSGLLAKNGKSLKVGTNLLVSGSLSSSLVTDSVVVGMGKRQNNFNSQLRGLFRAYGEQAAKKGIKDWIPPSGPRPSAGENAFFALQNPDPPLMGTITEEWEKVVGEPASPRLEDFVEHPLVFLTSSRAADLEKQLGHCHVGRPLVHLGVNGASDFGRFKDLLPAIMDGRAKGESLADSIRGTVMVSDPSTVLGDVLRAGDQECGWLGRLLWLVDGTAGPEPPDAADGETPFALDDLDQRYEAALNKAWAQRLNNQTTGPVIHEAEFPAWQARWIAFLNEMEQELPGITGTARNLLATLVFGLQGMTQTWKAPKGFKWYLPGVEALARFLVHRMANVRTATLWSAEKARKLQRQENMLNKLVDGPQRPRQLVRRFNRLTIAECREDLFFLLAAGKVVRDDEDLWSLSESALAQFKPMTIDV